MELWVISTSQVCVEEAGLTMETQGGWRGKGKSKRMESWKPRKKACSSVIPGVTKGPL